MLGKIRTDSELSLSMLNSGEFSNKELIERMSKVVEVVPAMVDMVESLAAQNAALVRMLERMQNGD